MKKIIIATIALLFGSFVAFNTAAFAQTTNDGGKMVKQADLPKDVQNTLTSKDYEGWDFSEGYVYDDQEGRQPYYKVQLKKGGLIKEVHLDKMGKNYLPEDKMRRDNKTNINK